MQRGLRSNPILHVPCPPPHPVTTCDLSQVSKGSGREEAAMRLAKRAGWGQVWRAVGCLGIYSGLLRRLPRAENRHWPEDLEWPDAGGHNCSFPSHCTVTALLPSSEHGPWSLIHQQIFTEHLLCAQHCFLHQGGISEHTDQNSHPHGANILVGGDRS